MHHQFRPMQSYALPLLVLFLIAGCTELGGDPSAPPQPQYALTDAVKGLGAQRMLVVLKDDVEPGFVARAHGVRAAHVFRHAVNGFAGPISQVARAGLLGDSRVLRLEPDLPTAELDAQPAGSLWNLDRLDQRSLPRDSIYTYRFTGEGVTAYVIDTGIRFDHADFEGRAVRGFDAIADGQNGSDCRGHGTHVAGTIGGRTWGVAKKVRLVSVRVSDCSGSGTVSGLIAGIDWVIRNNKGPAVANISLGAGKSEALNQAVRNLVAAGVQVAVAAGNSDADACGISPASTTEAVTVGSAGSAFTTKRRPYSNWGACVDLFAPGSSITSASHLDATSSTEKSGTSMAAPHAAGVMALYLHEDPSLTPGQLQEMLVANATKDIVEDAKSGNAHLLYSLRHGAVPPPTDTVAPPPPPADTSSPPPQPTAEFSSACDGLTCSFDGSLSASADDITTWEWSFGDGSTSAGIRVSRTYSAAAEYVVTLTVTDIKGATAHRSARVSPSAPAGGMAPEAPTGLAARLVALNRVDLSWNDRSGDEQKFEIERRPLGGAWALLATVSANTSSYSDRSVFSGQAYEFRVRAVNGGGASAYSNEVAVTVLCTTKGGSANCR